MRLLRLHARVIEFKWEMDRLPKTLDEMQLPVEEDSTTRFLSSHSRSS